MIKISILFVVLLTFSVACGECLSQSAISAKQIFEKLDERIVLPPKSFGSIANALDSVFKNAGLEVAIPDELAKESWNNTQISDSKFDLEFSTGTCVKVVLSEAGYTFVVTKNKLVIIKKDMKSSIEYSKIHDFCAWNGVTKEMWKEAVQLTLAPEVWEENGGNSSISLFDDFAIVECSEAIHHQLIKLNHFLRMYSNRSSTSANGHQEQKGNKNAEKRGDQRGK